MYLFIYLFGEISDFWHFGIERDLGYETTSLLAFKEISDWDSLDISGHESLWTVTIWGRFGTRNSLHCWHLGEIWDQKFSELLAFGEIRTRGFGLLAFKEISDTRLSGLLAFNEISDTRLFGLLEFKEISDTKLS
jgi:hypothetical protein